MGEIESVGQSPLFNGDALTSVITPPPLRGRGWGRGGHRCTRIHPILVKRSVSRLCWHLRAWMPPLPQPLPRKGGGEYIGPSQHFHSHPKRMIAVGDPCGARRGLSSRMILFMPRICGATLSPRKPGAATANPAHRRRHPLRWRRHSIRRLRRRIPSARLRRLRRRLSSRLPSRLRRLPRT